MTYAHIILKQHINIYINNTIYSHACMHILVLHRFFYTIKEYHDQKKTQAYNIYTYMHENMLFYMHLYKQTKQEQQSESKKLVIDC